MKYKDLIVAGCAALMFGLLACSGEDGRDGIDGVNGINGDNGASCEVKSLKDGSGYKVLCGGDSVGVLLNGKNGATGKQGITGATGANGENGTNGKDGKDGKAGESCTVKELSDKNGYEVICGSKSVGKLLNGEAGSNGTNCTAKTVEKDGQSGMEMYCDDKLVGTIWNGNDGVNCVSTDNGEGSVTVKCGDAAAVTLYKAMCGDQPYDPANQFCVLGKLYDKCGDKTYTINREFCNNGVVAPLCSEIKMTKSGTYEVVTNRATKTEEFCLAGIITKKCGGKEFSMNQYCDKKHDGVTDSIRDYCKYADDDRLEAAYNIIGQSLFPTEENNDVESSSASLFGNLIGEPPKNYTPEQLQEFFATLEGLKTTCGAEPDPDQCGGVAYNPEKKFCDIRDNHIYAFKKINGVTWFTENQAFKYKLPKINDELTGNITELEYENDPYENFEAGQGRFYTWNSAMGIGDKRADIDLTKTSLEEKDKVVGACPAG